jgi:hypothetical protein
LDGKMLPDGPTRIPLVDDGLAHKVCVILGGGKRVETPTREVDSGPHNARTPAAPAGRR